MLVRYLIVYMDVFSNVEETVRQSNSNTSLLQFWWLAVMLPLTSRFLEKQRQGERPINLNANDRQLCTQRARSGQSAEPRSPVTELGLLRLAVELSSLLKLLVDAFVF